TRSLIQTCGRAARNVNGKVFMYADIYTESMRKAVEETSRRRKIQERFNQLHHITPTSVEKRISGAFLPQHYSQPDDHAKQIEEPVSEFKSGEDLEKLIMSLEKEMREASKSLAFEKAAMIRDQIKGLKQLIIFDFAATS
ncbi:MAG: UvrB/UvrC motif-containing protein, partial [Desulfobacterales bacterium]|nr:UvrB/UvrC motif-containing protein [Desulfobacterales bacterium]